MTEYIIRSVGHHHVPRRFICIPFGAYYNRGPGAGHGVFVEANRYRDVYV
jgi:hypothetical protein